MRCLLGKLVIKYPWPRQEEIVRVLRFDYQDAFIIMSSIHIPARQRGTNENTNGTSRFYFPKGTDFRHISEKEVAHVVKKLNNRPRECLNYQTPHEAHGRLSVVHFGVEFA
jgi:hypothetical protein